MLQLMKYSEMKMGLIQNCCIKNYLSRLNASCECLVILMRHVKEDYLGPIFAISIGTVIFLLLHFQVTRFSTKMYLRQQPAIFFTTEMGISFLQRLEDWAKLTSRTTWSLLPAYSVYWASKVVGSCEKRQLDQCTGADTAGKISHCWKQCLNSFSFLDSLC